VDFLAWEEIQTKPHGARLSPGLRRGSDFRRLGIFDATASQVNHFGSGVISKGIFSRSVALRRLASKSRESSQGSADAATQRSATIGRPNGSSGVFAPREAQDSASPGAGLIKFGIRGNARGGPPCHSGQNRFPQCELVTVGDFNSSAALALAAVTSALRIKIKC